MKQPAQLKLYLLISCKCQIREAKDQWLWLLESSSHSWDWAKATEDIKSKEAGGDFMPLDFFSGMLSDQSIGWSKSHGQWQLEGWRSIIAPQVERILQITREVQLYWEGLLGGHNTSFPHKSDVLFVSNRSFKEISKNIILSSPGLIILFWKPLFTYIKPNSRLHCEHL